MLHNNEPALSTMFTTSFLSHSLCIHHLHPPPSHLQGQNKICPVSQDSTKKAILKNISTYRTILWNRRLNLNLEATNSVHVCGCGILISWCLSRCIVQCFYVRFSHNIIFAFFTMGHFKIRKMKSMWPPLMTIFFMTYFYKAGGTLPFLPLDAQRWKGWARHTDYQEVGRCYTQEVNLRNPL